MRMTLVYAVLFAMILLALLGVVALVSALYTGEIKGIVTISRSTAPVRYWMIVLSVLYLLLSIVVGIVTGFSEMITIPGIANTSINTSR